jgi:hypothetical protein
MIDSRLQRASIAPTRLPEARIVRRKDFTDDLFVLWLEPEISFDSATGQYITIGAGGAGGWSVV